MSIAFIRRVSTTTDVYGHLTAGSSNDPRLAEIVAERLFGHASVEDTDRTYGQR